MRYLIVFFVFLVSVILSTSTIAQTPSGQWTGRVDRAMRINLTLDSTLKMDLPGIGVDIKVADYKLTSDSLTANLVLTGGGKASLAGKFHEGYSMIKGEWRQEDVFRDFELISVNAFTPAPRDQLPLKIPFAYSEEDLSIYQAQQDFWLKGTLTIPHNDKDSIAAILISGSGQQDRNSEIVGHKPFLVLADHLATQGITVCRFDDRGVGESSGAFINATSEDFMYDVISVMDKLDSLGYKKICLIGHSEGGMIANMISALDNRVDAMVSLAGPAIPIEQLMLLQNKNVLLDQGVESTEVEDYLEFLRKAYKLIDVETPRDSLYDPLKELCTDFYQSRDSTHQKMYGESDFSFYIANASSYLSPWLRYFINHKPGEFIEEISCPVLALHGNMDIQVTSKENAAGYEKHLMESEAPFYDVITLDSINHLFQKVDHWNTYEYYESPESFNKEVMVIISDWIKSSVF